MAMSIFDHRPDFGGLGNQGQSNRSMLKNSALLNDANLMAKGMGAVGNVQGSKLMADAQISAANAQADATRSNGMWDMIGSIGGGLIGGMGKWGGGGTPTTGPDIGANQATNRWADPSLRGMSPSEVMEGQLGGFTMTPRDPITHPWK
jgi:hypothetical protein